MPDVNPFLTFLSLTIHQTTRSQTTFQKMDYSDALLTLDVSSDDTKHTNWRVWLWLILL